MTHPTPTSEQVARMKELAVEGYNNTQIGRTFNPPFNRSAVRYWLTRVLRDGPPRRNSPLAVTRRRYNQGLLG